MKKYSIYIFIIMLLVVLAFYAFYQPGNKNLKWIEFQDGLELAKSHNKKVLINVYTDWCKWCKKMDSEVFPNSDILKYINQKFIPIKLNGESSKTLTYKGASYTHSELVQAFGINGFPATIFLTSSGEPITVLPGFHNAHDYLKILKFIGDDLYEKMSYDEYLKTYK